MARRVALRSLALALAVAAAIPLAGCAVNPVSGKHEFAILSAEQERTFGRDEAKKVGAALGFVEDQRLEGYVQQVGARIAAQSPLKGVDYTFRVVDMPEPNAFALPGGYVYVTRGLLTLTNSEDELAGIVGHEVGHVAGRHAVQRVSRAFPIGILSVLGASVTGLVSPMLGDIIGDAGSAANEMLLAPYGREQEREADRVGAEMAAKAGWDPAALAASLRVLEREDALTRKGKSSRPSFFATHPPLPERAETVRTFAATLSPAPRRAIADSTAAYFERLDGLVIGKSAAEGVFDGPEFVHPDLAFAMTFPKDWRTQNTREAVGAGDPNGRATVVVDLAGEADDPMLALAAIDEASHSDLAKRAERTTIGGSRAAHVTSEIRTDSGPVALDITCVERGGRIFRIIGATWPSDVADYAGVFRTIAGSFRDPTPAELSRIRETRLRIARARAGETIDALVARTRSFWNPDMVAIANGLADDHRLTEGQLVKIAASEPYVAKR
jgi:predicted Zn-dependent protease